MRRIILLFAGLLALPTAAHAQVRRVTNDGFVYDIQDQAGGQLARGTEASGRFAYDGAYHLAVSVAGANPRCYDTGGRGASVVPGSGGELLLQEYLVPGSQVRARRRVWVPNATGEFVRYLDVFRNDGVTSVDLLVTISGDLGVTNAPVFLTGDRVLNDPSRTRRERNDVADNNDVWIGSDDDDAQGIPTIVHVLQGYDAGIAPGTVAPSCLTVPYDAGSDRCDAAVADPCGAGAGASGFRWDYRITVPAGETRALLTFGLQAPSRAEAVAEADRIVNLPEDALRNVDEALRDAIVNFQVDDLPRIVFEAPSEVDEGEPIVVRAEVTDPEGDAITWSWDLPEPDNFGDPDGTFGESPGALEVTVPGTITNGPNDWKIRLRAVETGDPTKVRTRTAVVQVRNVAPVIRSIPPTPRLFVGDSYEYDVEVDDALGEADAIGYLFRSRPTGMTVNAMGQVRWTVGTVHRGMTHTVILEVSDDGGERATQTWELVVENNLRPSAPVPLFPIDLTMPLGDRQPVLVIGNPSDPEGDDLELYVRLTANVTDFALEEWTTLRPDQLASGPIEPAAGDETEWRIPRALEAPMSGDPDERVPGTYFWEVWAEDALGARSESRFASFTLQNPAPPDGGTRRPPVSSGDDGGCAVGGGAAGGPGVLALGLAALLVARRRRR